MGVVYRIELTHNKYCINFIVTIVYTEPRLLTWYCVIVQEIPVYGHTFMFCMCLYRHGDDLIVMNHTGLSSNHETRVW